MEQTKRNTIQTNTRSRTKKNPHKDAALNVKRTMKLRKMDNDLNVVPPEPILLLDNTTEDNNSFNDDGRGDDDTQAQINTTDTNTRVKQTHEVWAKNVHVDDSCLVTGSDGYNVGSYTVWTIRIQATNGGNIILHKRYSDFDRLRRKLVRNYGDSISKRQMELGSIAIPTSNKNDKNNGIKLRIPELPPKSVFNNFKKEFLSERRQGLEFFLASVLLDPRIGKSNIVKEFLSINS